MIENNLNIGNETSDTEIVSGKDHDETEDSLIFSCNREEILKECIALIVYISRHGDVLPDNETDQGDKGINKAYEELVEGVIKCNSTKAGADDWQALVMAYTKVTRFTYAQQGVNGRSVLDTLGGAIRILDLVETGESRHSRKCLCLSWLSCIMKRKHLPLFYTGVLLITALVLQLCTGWTGRVSDPETLTGYWKKLLHDCVIDLAPILVPAVWGAIGACVYLMKRISDKLGKLAYEQSRQQGNGARILLGAILAVIVVELIFPDQSATMAVEDVNLRPIAVAFVTGLSIKPIYTAFETLVDGLAQRFSTKNNHFIVSIP